MRKVVLMLAAVLVVGLAVACGGSKPDPNDPMMPDPMMPDNPPMVAPLDSSVALR